MKISEFKFSITFLLIFISFNSFAQLFEGHLTYKIDFEVLPKMKKMGMTKELLVEQMKMEGLFYGSQVTTYSKTGFYRVNFDNSNKTWSIYRPDSNKVYTFIKASDTCSVLDVEIDIESELTKKETKIFILDTVVTILNKPCSVIRIKWQSGYYDYAYHRGLFRVNPVYYQNYKFEGWAEFIKKSECLPLQITKVTEGMMSITYTIVDFKEEKIDDTMFIIPELVPIENDIIPVIRNKKIARIK